VTRAALVVFMFASVVATIGLSLCAFTASALEAEPILQSIATVATAAFREGPWAWLMPSAGMTTAAVVALSGLEWSLRTRHRAKGPLAHDGSGGLRAVIARARSRIEDCVARNGHNVVEAFEEMVRGAVAAGASDIHLSPSFDSLVITYRVDATLYEVIRLPAEFGPRLSIRAKVLAHLDTQARGLPQDGRVAMQLDGQRVDIRLSALPTDSGERLALRLVRGARNVPELTQLGFAPDVTASLKEVLGRAQGVFFVTGAVGSGKTTTLYSALRYISEIRGSTTSIVTLEDPIELDLPFATQTQMNTRTGMTFAASLRSVLRQDPNVLMLGEIRDRETAEIAMQASLTGHLILTTVHADSAAGPFARLSELEVESFVLASATIGCLSQRLVRTLCTQCRREAAPDPMLRDRLARYGFAPPAARCFEPTGCPACEGVGFIGRLPIAELIILGPDLRKAVHDRRPSNEVLAIARTHGMRTLLEDGLLRVAAGETSLAEVLRVVG
jgi:general secretion pathway protein E